MRSRRGRRARHLVAAAGIVGALLVPAGPGAAEPKKVFYIEFTCEGGSSFVGRTIEQNQASNVQVVEGGDGRVFVFSLIANVDGTVYYEVPGLEDKGTVACTTDWLGPTIVFTGFFAPR